MRDHGAVNVRALQYLVAVADEGSFGRAAQRMHVAQPSISQAVRRLEEQFGLMLLDRSGSRVVATADGVRVLEDVRAALRHLDRALERSGGNTSVASLRIACTSLAAVWLVPHLLNGFGAAHPEIEVAVAELDVPAQAEALLAGRVDMTFGEALPWHSDLDALVVGDLPCVIWMAETHPLAAQTDIELGMLEGVPLALGHPDVYPTYGPWVLAQLEAARVPATIAPPARDTPSAFRAILAGDCVALAADMFSADAMPGLAIRPVRGPVRWPWTVTRARTRSVPTADALVAWAQSDAAKTVGLAGTNAIVGEV